MIDTSSVLKAKSSPTPELRARAEAELRSGELEEASALALELSRHPSVRPWDIVVLGRIATANGEATAAIKWGKEAQGEGPEEGAVLVHLFIAFAAAKKWSHAASTLTSAIAKRPDIADFHQHHAYICLMRPSSPKPMWRDTVRLAVSLRAGSGTGSMKATHHLGIPT
jgi:predicted Zn-dependent protease